MPQAKIHFKACHQKSQVMGSDGNVRDHLEAELLFDLEVDGKLLATDLKVGIGQPYGTSYSVEPLEADSIRSQYDGLWNHGAFAEGCEHYYRKLVARVVSTNNTSRLTMSNNRLVMPFTVEFDLPASSGGAW